VDVKRCRDRGRDKGGRASSVIDAVVNMLDDLHRASVHVISEGGKKQILEKKERQEGNRSAA
jgi:hypothetical protein